MTAHIGRFLIKRRSSHSDELINVACWLKPVGFEEIILPWPPAGRGKVTPYSSQNTLGTQHTQAASPKDEARSRKIVSPKGANGGTYWQTWKSKQLILWLVQFPSQMSADSQYSKMVSIFLVTVFLHTERRCQWDFPGLNQYDRTQVWSYEVRVFLRSLFCFDWSVVNPEERWHHPPLPPIFYSQCFYPHFASFCKYCISSGLHFGDHETPCTRHSPIKQVGAAISAGAQASWVRIKPAVAWRVNGHM